MTVQSVTTLGGTASHVKVGKVAHGVMMMTWTPKPVPDDIAFEAIKAGIDSMPSGVRMYISSCEFFSLAYDTANLELLARFFEKYPGYADRVFLAVHGGSQLGSLKIDASPENLRRSITNINAALRGTKRVDLFQCGRVDQSYPIWETIGLLKGFIAEGLFDHIGMTECSAATVRRAHAVHPITAVEIEVSPWSMESETKKVLATAQELDIAVIAYSPLGRGFLTGQIKSFDDIPEGDLRRRLTRFCDPECFKANLALVDALTALAAKKSSTPSKLCIAFVASLGPKVIPIPGSSSAMRTLENTYAADEYFAPEELAEIWKIIDEYEVKGDRYFGLDPKAMNLWG
ncbi:hypothetical protein PHLGIDRAFT_291020 [Phlebiopsis gigantea 11061_1 CR5-6]|uniref:NADP-dependent oxidoreductase domain-containing protein n=1 Tax=Phlebiopsis gigantea (strain 11061_1 CR5-6) TaxID=745531 RepID=A0A0C3RR92_PHLG1|nr:hypothetical protein PHLGIDRAFT_291020 [Phlebiopsis gigantea 11061_1 CR5-6]